MIRKILMLAVTSGLAAQALRLWIQREREAGDARRQSRSAQAAREADRWADDGGAPVSDNKRGSTPRRRARSAKAA